MLHIVGLDVDLSKVGRMYQTSSNQHNLYPDLYLHLYHTEETSLNFACKKNPRVILFRKQNRGRRCYGAAALKRDLGYCRQVYRRHSVSPCRAAEMSSAACEGSCSSSFPEKYHRKITQERYF